MKISPVICPHCNKGNFENIGNEFKCSICGEVLTDEIIEKELDKAWVEHQEELKKELSSNQKLDLINSMEVIDHSVSCGECEYVLVEDNETNRGILHSIGLTDEDIEMHCCPEEEVMDISRAVWERTNANWYSPKEKRFYE